MYEVALCEDTLMLEKAENLREVVQLSRVTQHHGLVYTLERHTCEYFEDKMYSYATFYVTCENRESEFKKACVTVECYLTKSRSNLWNASYGSFQRWHVVEAHLGKYPLRLSKLVKMPEFKLVKEVRRHHYVLKCPLKYSLWNNHICLPCLSGHYYDNQTATCTECLANTYQPFDLMTDCFSCPPGWSTEVNGSRDSQPCIEPANAISFFVTHHVFFITAVGVLFILMLAVSVIHNKREATVKRERQEQAREAMRRKDRLAGERAPVLHAYTGSTKVLTKSHKPLIQVDRFEFLKEAQKRRKKIPRKVKTYVFAT